MVVRVLVYHDDSRNALKLNCPDVSSHPVSSHYNGSVHFHVRTRRTYWGTQELPSQQLRSVSSVSESNTLVCFRPYQRKQRKNILKPELISKLQTPHQRHCDTETHKDACYGRGNARDVSSMNTTHCI